VRLLASPSTKIVSLTITEFGYRVPINEGDRALVRAALEGATDAEGPEGRRARRRGGAGDARRHGFRHRARRARVAAAARLEAVHDHVLRQPAAQRRGGEAQSAGRRRGPGPVRRDAAVAGGGGALPEHDGGPHHPRHLPRRPRVAQGCGGRGRRVAGDVRAVQALGHRGRLRGRRAPRLGARGRRAGARRAPARAHEGAPAQRRAQRHVLRRRARRVRARARGGDAQADPPVPEAADA
jgi:hypothetical protein